eukprot:scaffold10020_cov122-Isochrysis_galbana.AAC.11
MSAPQAPFLCACPACRTLRLASSAAPAVRVLVLRAIHFGGLRSSPPLLGLATRNVMASE